MQFADYWQQFEHTGSVEDYLNYLQSAGKREKTDTVDAGCRKDCRAEGRTALSAGEDGSCRNPCM